MYEQICDVTSVRAAVLPLTGVQNAERILDLPDDRFLHKWIDIAEYAFWNYSVHAWSVTINLASLAAFRSFMFFLYFSTLGSLDDTIQRAPFL